VRVPTQSIAFVIVVQMLDQLVQRNAFSTYFTSWKSRRNSIGDGFQQRTGFGVAEASVALDIHEHLQALERSLPAVLLWTPEQGAVVVHRAYV
jgi:hypothetical protein